MKQTVSGAAITFFVLMISFIGLSSCQKNDDPAILKGPYLGQKPPGMIPEVFAPGVLNTKTMGAFCSVFSPDGNEFYFVYYERENETSGGMAWMQRVNDVWLKPEMLHFNSDVTDNDMCMSADGNRLIFRSWRTLPGGQKPEDRSYLWFVDRTEDGWSQAKLQFCGDIPVRTGYPSLAANGILYFAQRDVEVFGIYRSKPVNGAYGATEYVFTALDGVDTEGDMFVAPDESYMIISCWDHPDNIGSGQGDLYITFEKDNGEWTEAINMGERINTQYGENCPQVSPDGKYFFFNRYNPDAKEGNIYWVDAGIIEEYRPKDNFPVLRGAYLGEKPPGMTAKIFAPEIISTLEMPEMCAAFTADAKEFLYNAQYKGQWSIFLTREINGQWIKPKPIGFTSGYTDRDFTISPDGQKIYFGSNRPRKKNGEPLGALDIYMSERIDEATWTEPINLGSVVNSDLGENYPSVANNGNLYFFSNREDSLGGCDIYVSRFIAGSYLSPKNLGSAINSAQNDWDSFIAPDESYIIFSSQNRDDTLGGQDLYVSFKKEDGSWTNARNMGPGVNSKAGEICPSVSLDGQYIFFTSRRRGKADIFWVSIDILKRL